MTDAEIAKARAHYEYGITHDIFKEPVTSYAKTVLWAFEEINRQKAEIERLREFGNKLRKAYTMAYSNGFGLCKSIFFKKLENALADNIDISNAQYESIMFDVHNIVDELKIEKLTE